MVTVAGDDEIVRMRSLIEVGVRATTLSEVMLFKAITAKAAKATGEGAHFAY